jgi:hypothetical protein
MLLQRRNLSARRPGAHPMGPLAQSALADEDNGAPLAQGIILIQGQSTFFQRATAYSSRSSGRPTGRWQPQLRLSIIGHTCERWWGTRIPL